MAEKPTYEALENRVRELERMLSDRATPQDRPQEDRRDGNDPPKGAGQYRLMVENASEAILVARDGVFVFSNPRGEALFGYPAAELGSRPLTEFVHGADRRMVGERHEARLAGDTSLPDFYDFRIIHRSGDIRWVSLKVTLFSWEGGPASLCFMTDITKRKQAEEALRESEARFRRIVETAEEGIWLVNRKWETEFVNPRMAEMLGYQPKEMIGKPILSFMGEQEQQRARELMARREQGVNEKHDFKFQRRDGSGLWTIVSTNAITSEDGRFMHALAMVADITDRKRVETALRESETRYRMVVQDQTEVISRFLPDGTFTFVNQVYCDFFGKKEHELLGNQWVPVAHPDDVEMIQSKLAELSPANPVVNIENRVYSGKDRLHWFRFVNRGFFDRKGRLSEIQSVGRDITDRKRAEAALQKSLAEKEVLLREIHHRVKNNMQTIVGLLRMHARRIDDHQLTGVFNDCRDRIGAMSLIHEALYKSDDLSRIDFEAYLKKLCRNLAQAHDAGRKGITLTVSAADVSLNMDQGVAVGMIIAELISNAFKHAFPDGEGGTVAVHLDRPDRETVRLIVSDTGNGLPPDFDIQNPSSLGLRLVSGAVTRELGGRLEIERNGGVTFVIRFKCEK